MNKKDVSLLIIGIGLGMLIAGLLEINMIILSIAIVLVGGGGLFLLLMVEDSKVKNRIAYCVALIFLVGAIVLAIFYSSGDPFSYRFMTASCWFVAFLFSIYAVALYRFDRGILC